MFLNIPGFRVCQVSAYARVAQGSEYNWIWLNNHLWQDSVLNMPGQRFTGTSGFKYSRAQNVARLWICKGYTGCWICLNKPEYALIMPQYLWICFNNTEYDWTYRPTPEKIYWWICQNSECVCTNYWAIIETKTKFRTLSNTEDKAFCKKNNIWV